MLVQVTKDDIDQGVPANNRRCAVSRRLTAMGCENVRTVYMACHWQKGDSLYEADIPPNVRLWIRRFDQGVAVSPINFILHPVKVAP